MAALLLVGGPGAVRGARDCVAARRRSSRGRKPRRSYRLHSSFHGNVVSPPPTASAVPYPQIPATIRTLPEAPSSTRPLVSPEKKRKKKQGRERERERKKGMAQSMLMSSLGGRRLGEPVTPAQSLVRRLRPERESLVLLFPPALRRGTLPSPSYAPTLAIFKPKTKAVPKKVGLPSRFHWNGDPPLGPLSQCFFSLNVAGGDGQAEAQG